MGRLGQLLGVPGCFLGIVVRGLPLKLRWLLKKTPPLISQGEICNPHREHSFFAIQSISYVVTPEMPLQQTTETKPYGKILSLQNR